jgi:hypothetical protein
MLFTTIFNLTPLIPLSSQERGKKKKEGLKPLSDSRFKIPLALPCLRRSGYAQAGFTKGRSYPLTMSPPL